MRICIALHQVMDLGGIINHTEQLAGGLKDLGHTVHLQELVYSNDVRDQNKSGDFTYGPTGIPYNQGKGWNFKRSQRIPYKTSAGLQAARQILSGYDLVIWSVPVPSKNKNNIGNSNWPALYDLHEDTKQIAFIHDGNSRQGVPHLTHIQDKLVGVACVHHCALNSSNHLTVPRALILNPQFQVLQTYPGWEQKKTGFINMQTFKAWKHVHELVEAIAYMPKITHDELRDIAGLGIEYRYMNSETKCKDQYFHADGRRFWDAALKNGMCHHDYWNDNEVHAMCQNARVLVDPSWSKKYSKFGGHYNRVIVDAMMRGAVPVARFMGVGDDLFKPNEHYIEIPQDADPNEYAHIIWEASHMSERLAKVFQSNATEIISMFNRKYVADNLIHLAFGNLKTQIGERDLGLETKTEDLLYNHFGIL